MRSIILIIFFDVIIPLRCLPQQKINSDSLISEICRTVKIEKLETDSLTIANSFRKHLLQYRNKVDKQAWQQLIENCYFRLQRECPEFKKIIDKIDPTKGDWKRVDFEPESRASETDCADFFRISNFTYLEYNGDTAKVVITDSTW